jgi:hypothetical protein
MGLWDKLRQASNYVRKLRLSRGPDSYFQYKRRREYKRKDAERARKQAQGSADRRRDETERERAYEERYAGESARDIARERTERAEEMEPDR